MITPRRRNGYSQRIIQSEEENIKVTFYSGSLKEKIPKSLPSKRNLLLISPSLPVKDKKDDCKSVKSMNRCSYSSKRGLDKSPSRAGYLKATPDAFKLPEKNSNPTDRFIKSPKRGTVSSARGFESPERGYGSLGKTSTSRERSLVNLSERGSTSPKKDFIKSLEGDSTSLERDFQSPEYSRKSSEGFTSIVGLRRRHCPQKSQSPDYPEAFTMRKCITATQSTSSVPDSYLKETGVAAKSEEEEKVLNMRIQCFMENQKQVKPSMRRASTRSLRIPKRKYILNNKKMSLAEVTESNEEDTIVFSVSNKNSRNFLSSPERKPNHDPRLNFYNREELSRSRYLRYKASPLLSIQEIFSEEKKQTY